jgi:hypothetical protein
VRFTVVFLVLISSMVSGFLLGYYFSWWGVLFAGIFGYTLGSCGRTLIDYLESSKDG